MKNIIASFCFLTSTLLVHSQEFISSRIGQNHTSFRFFDSSGEKDTELTTDVRISFAGSYTKNIDISSGNYSLMLRTEMENRNWGALSMYNNERLSWNLQYMAINLGSALTYDGLNNKLRLTPYAGGVFYLAYLYKAQQQVGIAYYNMLTPHSIRNSDYGAGMFVGAFYELSSKIVVDFELRQLYGLCQLEPDQSDNGQRLYNKAFSIQIGLSFALPGRRSTEDSHKIGNSPLPHGK